MFTLLNHSRKIRAAIIDDGVHPDILDLDGDWYIDEECNDLANNVHENKDSGHANMCIQVIKKYTDMSCTLWHSIKILDFYTKRGNIERLIKAFELCEDLDIKIIHLSIGTTYYEDFHVVKNAVNRLVKKGVILVCATSNSDVVTYPAYLPNVIGVKCDPLLIGDTYYFNDDPIEQINFIASSRHNNVLTDILCDSIASNSLAAPLLTAKVISYLKINPSMNVEDVHSLLVADASNAKNLCSKLTSEASHKDENQGLSKPPDIPIVILSGFDYQKLIKLIKHLHINFSIDDYHCRIALENTSDNLSEVIPISKEADIDFFAQRINDYFACDILLIGFLSPVKPERCKYASLWVWGESVDTSFDYVIPDYQVGVITKNESIDEVYEMIMSILL